MHPIYIMAKKLIGIVRVIFSDSSHTVPEGIENQARPTPFDGFVILRLIWLLFPEHGINSFDGYTENRRKLKTFVIDSCFIKSILYFEMTKNRAVHQMDGSEKTGENYLLPSALMAA